MKEWKKSLLIGTFVGILFAYFVYLDVGFIIGTPASIISYSLETTGRFITTTILAGSLEEIFFRIIVFGILFNILPITSGNFLLSNILQALGFSAYHTLAYGSFIDGSVLFVSAFIFGLTMGFVAYFINKDSNKWNLKILACVTAHAFVNGALIFTTVAIAPSLGIVPVV